MYQRIGPAAYKPDIGNITELCELTGNPQTHYKTIHVAGTNGKGSVCNMLAAIFQQAGYKTGLHTSPHLKDLTERMRVNGIPASQEFIIEYVNTWQNEIERMNPSFFELTVAMSFTWFSMQRVDVAIIETGLGGRLDSTNIVRPLVSIITNVQMDHMNLLGDTLQEIAGEKAGIIKPNTPVVIGPGNPTMVTDVIKKKAEIQHAPVYIAHTVSNPPECDLQGAYQTDNIATVLQSVNILNETFTNLNTGISGLKDVSKLTGFAGRWQQIQKNPEIILDVCHNADGLKASLKTLNKHNYKNLFLIVGFSEDKDVTEMIQLLPLQATIIASSASVPRAMNTQKLAEKFYTVLQKNVTCIEGAQQALTFAKQSAKPDDLILVLGSVFLIADLL
jgi:dihydrofolate synthase/folylpolyglutamate synthase